MPKLSRILLVLSLNMPRTWKFQRGSKGSSWSKERHNSWLQRTTMLSLQDVKPVKNGCSVGHTGNTGKSWSYERRVSCLGNPGVQPCLDNFNKQEVFSVLISNAAFSKLPNPQQLEVLTNCVRTNWAENDSHHERWKCADGGWSNRRKMVLGKKKKSEVPWRRWISRENLHFQSSPVPNSLKFSSGIRKLH